MSKYQVLHTHGKVLNDIRTMSKETLEEFYEITIDDNGTVYDLAESKQFSSIQEWAAFLAEQQDEEKYKKFEKKGGRYRFDDDD